jgi:hypothetical protein
MGSVQYPQHQAGECNERQQNQYPKPRRCITRKLGEPAEERHRGAKPNQRNDPEITPGWKY